ncbi:pyridoxamine 5'-phosphate oxidase family protein [Chloroflexota bacterium]
MDKQEAIKQALDIIEKSRHCLLGTNGDDGYPNIKTMSNRRKHEGLKKIWLHTDASSRRVQQLGRDNRACIYYLDGQQGRGLMLVGDIEILQDLESKNIIWTEEDGKYYPLGIEDPEYTVLCFTAKRADFVDAMKNDGLTFDIDQ